MYKPLCRLQAGTISFEIGPDMFNQSNFYSANIPGEGKFSGAMYVGRVNIGDATVVGGGATWIMPFTPFSPRVFYGPVWKKLIEIWGKNNPSDKKKSFLFFNASILQRYTGGGHPLRQTSRIWSSLKRLILGYNLAAAIINPELFGFGTNIGGLTATTGGVTWSATFASES